MKFSVNAKSSDQLVFSYVGYKTQYVKVLNRTAINVTLLEDNELLDSEIGNDEMTEVFAYHLASLFFEYLAASESLIRTTPDLSMDSVEAMVLGLI